uniref:Uncharacterized protein n=1 Tax=Oryza meridionalis TaxID=40149 RepID=A0A0E0CEJ6_9ORYZ
MPVRARASSLTMGARSTAMGATVAPSPRRAALLEGGRGVAGVRDAVARPLLRFALPPVSARRSVAYRLKKRAEKRREEIGDDVEIMTCGTTWVPC